MAEAADETDAARALLAAKDFSNLAAMLVPDGVPSEFLIDELSFELVAPILTHHAAAPAATTAPIPLLHYWSSVTWLCLANATR